MKIFKIKYDRKEKSLKIGTIFFDAAKNICKVISIDKKENFKVVWISREDIENKSYMKKGYKVNGGSVGWTEEQFYGNIKTGTFKICAELEVPEPFK